MSAFRVLALGNCGDSFLVPDIYSRAHTTYDTIIHKVLLRAFTLSELQSAWQTYESGFQKTPYFEILTGSATGGPSLTSSFTALKIPLIKFYRDRVLSKAGMVLDFNSDSTVKEFSKVLTDQNERWEKIFVGTNLKLSRQDFERDLLEQVIDQTINPEIADSTHHYFFGQGSIYDFVLKKNNPGF